MPAFLGQRNGRESGKSEIASRRCGVSRTSLVSEEST
jgi:hypothetical protein